MARKRKPVKHPGVEQVPYQLDAHPLEILARALGQVLTHINDEEWELVIDPWLRPMILHHLEFRIAYTEPSVSPNWRLAIVEVSGAWIDSKGTNHHYQGLEKQDSTPQYESMSLW